MLIPARLRQLNERTDRSSSSVWTNGVINAQEAVSLAAKVLTDHLNLFVDLSDKGKSTEIMVEKDEGGLCRGALLGHKAHHHALAAFLSSSSFSSGCALIKSIIAQSSGSWDSPRWITPLI